MYILEGNIGSGKSTFLNLIEKHLPFVSISQEPLFDWGSLLEDFYKNPKRWAFTFEVKTLVSRVKQHIKEQSADNPFLIMERSVYSGRFCFALNSYESGFLNENEWILYAEIFDQIVPIQCQLPNGFIYLLTSPEKSLERMQKRDRLSESSISIDYLKTINKKHNQFFITKETMPAYLRQVPILIINCNDDFEFDPEIQSKMFDQINNFLFQTSGIKKFNQAETF